MAPNDTLPPAEETTSAKQRWLAEHLMDTIHTEQRLLQELRRVLQQQRAAIAALDHGALDDTTFGIQRIMHTLNEASRRPRLINQQLAGAASVPFTALAESVGVPPSPALVQAQNDLREAARLLEDEVRTNRALLAQALGSET